MLTNYLSGSTADTDKINDLGGDLLLWFLNLMYTGALFVLNFVIANPVVIALIIALSFIVRAIVKKAKSRASAGSAKV